MSVARPVRFGSDFPAKKGLNAKFFKRKVEKNKKLTIFYFSLSRDTVLYQSIICCNILPPLRIHPKLTKSAIRVSDLRDSAFARLFSILESLQGIPKYGSAYGKSDYAWSFCANRKPSANLLLIFATAEHNHTDVFAVFSCARLNCD
jgi:hypothetical protein